MSQPAIFVSHGAPDIVIKQSDARTFLEQDLPRYLQMPDAIVIVSAHFEASGAQVVGDPEPEMIYDFGGFSDQLYSMVYPAKGDPELAVRIEGLLKAAGIPVRTIARRGFDHGAWSPLMLMFPDADIPVVQVSVDPDRDALYHYNLGKALAPLREENILLIGSGHITHNLRAVFMAMRGGVVEPEMPAKISAFTEWLAERFSAGDRKSILEWKNHAPFSKENHPTDEHLMPLFFAFGAGGEDSQAKRLHTSTQYELLQSDVWAFS